MTTAEKYDLLLKRLSGMDSLLVAYSGGIDSTLLAFAAHAELGDRAVAAFANGDFEAPGEAESARALARTLGFNLIEVDTFELADPRIAVNPVDRCYHCKNELFTMLKQVAEARGLAHVADGANLDDGADYRPGRRATAELGILSPLAEASLTKSEIREIARDLGLPNWDKPSMACLASRFPYGNAITEEGIARVGRAETSLRALGLKQVRVRDHGDVGRIEVASAELERAWELRTPMSDAVREAGFAYATLDLEGYRTGSMNEVL